MSIEFKPFLWKNLTDGPIIGVDEVGRGCLAGPVYAAAVILDPEKNLKGITDSKKVSAIRRKELSIRILEEHQVCIAFATVDEISQLNILHASLLAMKRAVEGLKIASGHVLVDGNQKVTNLSKSFKQTTLIKGDLRATPIAAASIAAKVARDELLVALSEKYPNYGFELHKGYATPIHQAAIKQHGPCEIHRKTFGGVREYLSLARPSL